MYSRPPSPWSVKSTSHTSYGLNLPSIHGLMERNLVAFSFRQTCRLGSFLHTVLSSNSASMYRRLMDLFMLENARITPLASMARPTGHSSCWPAGTTTLPSRL